MNFLTYSAQVLTESTMMKGHETAAKLRDAIDKATSDPKRRSEMYAKESTRVAQSAARMTGDVAERFKEAADFLMQWSKHSGPAK